MHLRIQPHAISRQSYAEPLQCPHDGCEGTTFVLHQDSVRKQIEDFQIEAVAVKRYRCQTCGRTFRDYPEGITQASRSDRMKSLGVFLYAITGLGYGGVAQVMEALGIHTSKTSIHRDVDQVGHIVNQLPRTRRRRVRVVISNSTEVICEDKQVTIKLPAVETDVSCIDIVTDDRAMAASLAPLIEFLERDFDLEIVLPIDVGQPQEMMLSLEVGGGGEKATTVCLSCVLNETCHD